MVFFGRFLILVLMLAVLAGVVLLLSPPPPTGPGDPDLRPLPGHSLLKAVLDGLYLGYELPTSPPLQIKALVFRGGAALMAAVALVCWGLSFRRPIGPRSADGLVETLRRIGSGDGGAVSAAERDEAIGAEAAGAEESAGRRTLFGRPIPWRRPSLLGWSLFFLIVYLTWTGLSRWWSHSPRDSITWLAGFGFVAAFAVVVGVSLDRRLVRVGAVGWLVLLAAIVLMMAWYRAARSPLAPLRIFTLDSKELGGILLPGIVLATALAVGRLAEWLFPSDQANRSVGGIVAVIASLSLAGGAAWMLRYCASGALWAGALAVPVGLATAAVLLTRGRWRTLWALLMVVAVLAVAAAWSRSAPPRLSGEPESAARASFQDDPLIDQDRWLMAVELGRRAPIRGQGGWGYRLLADRLARGWAAVDPRWADRPVSEARSFWLEQWVDFGLVGVGLLLGAVATLLAAAAQGIGRCPWRGHRYLMAGLAGGLMALLVQELFASSAYRYVFGAVLAGWTGLTAASVRWAWRRSPPGHDEYQWGFYRGGLSFLVGAATVSLAVGYVVFQDWQAARNSYKAQTSLLASVAEGVGLEEIARLDQAARWAIDQDRRFAALWQVTVRRFARVAGEIRQTLQRQRELARRAAQGYRVELNPVPRPVSAGWAQELEDIEQVESYLGRIHPGHVLGVPKFRARALLLAVQGRALSEPSDAIDREMAADLLAAADLLDSHLRAVPNDLPAVLLRITVADPVDLADRFELPAQRLARLPISHARLGLTPARRAELLRDGLRDYGLAAWADSAIDAPRGLPEWLGASRVVGDTAMPAVPARFFDALAAFEVEPDPATIARMLRAAETVEHQAGQPGGDLWPVSGDPDIRNAPQTFRLQAERMLLRNHVLGRAGLAGLAGQEDFLVQADRWLARAERLYEADPSRFATQRVIVALERAQLAWQIEGPASASARRHAQRAGLAMIQADPLHRPACKRAVGLVNAFLLDGADQAAVALAWFERAGLPVRQGMNLQEFRRRVAQGWREWLAPRKSPPGPPTSPLPPGAGPQPLWPIRLPSLRDLLGL